MALNKDMKLWEMKRFLHEELKEQILLEIAPILHVGIPQGGYFGVTRQILCLVEFLGTLYCGYDKKRDGKDIAQTWKAEKFIKEVMGKDFDKNYEANGELMYTMYRHGLVHLYQPKTLKLKDGTELRWMAYKGGRDEHEEEIAGLKFTNVRHLGKVKHPKEDGIYYLAISIICLYYDLITAVDLYWRLLEQDEDLQKKWISVANVISEPESVK
ncbi:hypothetical protein A2961_04110 [Candidatus Woesebacteria bacterium RIFCSPLOWO2_01_FULL_39_21]|uniref:Uncharacterized protein n=1 Tax=Candidatus Woesebacteria bacterium RIFCSPLOWO2_01_FULL_39_21 TaxID=1802519 RepID=A0A1F8BBV6_9BACT|nr:MAG: hypothetical protein A2961_04110 [Candidatus Woesebacteria bacterium RIFCSPLOWO2_01_FULL_39_21]